MSITETYFNGLTVVTTATLWLLGALTPVVLGALVFWSLYGPLRRCYWKLYAWRNTRHARHVRTQATRVHVSGG